MRDIYLLVIGVLAGVMARDWIESMERRIEYRAADRAAENIEDRRRWQREEFERRDDVLKPAPAPAP